MTDTLKPRRRPKQIRSAATVEAILTASRRLLIRDGYARFTTARVAKVAGVSIGSLYEYFPSKDALLSAIVDGFLESMFSELTDAIQFDGTLEEAVRRMMGSLLKVKSRDVELNAVLVEQLPRVNGSERLAAFNRRLEPVLAAYLDRYASELVGIDLEMASFVLMNAVQGVLTETVKRRTTEDPRMVEELTALVLGYLKTRGA